MTRLKNKVAIITGGNSGIGKGIAKHFLAEGAQVVIFGRNQQSLDQAKEELGDPLLVVQGDVTNTQHLENLYKQTLLQYGQCDILVANAGVGERIHIDNATEENFDRMVDSNYRGTFFTVRHALTYLNPRASIILIASCGATITLKRHSIYASTKAAIVKLAKSFAYDLADRSIRVNSISPGYVKTPIFDERLRSDPGYLSRREANIPLKRIGTPQDIANAALFLASDESSYITGIDLLVDGGYSASFPEPT
ncbi:MAG: glucose 1-dehydrogenase [Gammaproteobacteria bacterium]|nr:glucose 1-dehydrogenase [Gammaproteobacteria bacterium]